MCHSGTERQNRWFRPSVFFRPCPERIGGVFDNAPVGNRSDQLFGRVNYSGGTETANGYVTDRRGFVLGVVDASGNSMATANYDAFGNVISQTGNLGRRRGVYFINWKRN